MLLFFPVNNYAFSGGFIQSNLHCTQGVHFPEPLHEFPVNQTHDLGIAYATEQQEHIIQSK